MSTTVAMPPSLSPDPRLRHAGTSNEPPANRAFVLFFTLSVLLHLSVLLIVSLGPLPVGFPGTQAQKFKEDDSMIVDVVDLPPSKSAKEAAGGKPTHHAQRSQRVDKETFPERSAASGRFSTAQKSNRINTAKTQPIEPPQSVKERAPASDMYKSDTADGTAPNPSSAPSAAAHDKATRPELFPSRTRLSELERRYAAESPKGEKGKTLQLNTSELKFQRYLLGMKNRIEGRWVYPELAVRNGWQGSLYISFVIRKDGSVSDIKLEKSSNYPALDDAAITAIRLAASFPPFPENFDIEEINIKGHFVYDILESPAER